MISTLFNNQFYDFRVYLLSGILIATMMFPLTILPPADSGCRATPSTNKQERDHTEATSPTSTVSTPLASPTSTSTYSSFSPSSSARSSICSTATNKFGSSTVSSPPRIRSRTQKEANQQVRIRSLRERSFSAPKERDQLVVKTESRGFKHRLSNSLPLGGSELGHEQSLTRMAALEQQKWITVQQKTFTKW